MNLRPRSLLSCARPLPASRSLLLLGAALLSGGCVLNGDFGRVRPELVADNMHDWVGRDAVARIGGPVSRIPHHRSGTRAARPRLSADRAALRPQPLGQRAGANTGLARQEPAPQGQKPAFDRTAYLLMLHEVYRRSEASAYAQIVTDARNDVERLHRSSRSPVVSPTWTGGAMQSLAHVVEPQAARARQCGRPQS